VLPAYKLIFWLVVTLVSVGLALPYVLPLFYSEFVMKPLIALVALFATLPDHGEDGALQGRGRKPG
jgi:hypothetical protein